MTFPMILDLTCFYSDRELYDTLKFIEGIEEHLKTKIEKLIVPTIIYQLIMEEEHPQNFSKILSKYDRFRARRSRFPNIYYVFLRRLKDQYRIFPCSEFFNPETDRFGEESITIRDFISRLGKEIGKITYEILIVAKNTGGLILAIGNALKHHMQKMKIATITLYSKTKEFIKNDSGIKRKIMLIAFIYPLNEIKRMFLYPPLLWIYGPYISYLSMLLHDIALDAFFLTLNG